MWVPGSLAFFALFIVYVYRWLEPAAADAAPAVEPRHRGALMDVIASFLAGSILGWAMPLVLLIAVTIWWMIAVRRRSRD